MTASSWAHALTPGPRSTAQGEATIEHREIGRVRLPSGRVVAADPFVDPDLPPFTRRVTPGAYPVRLAIAHYPKDRDQRVAAAWLLFRDAPVASWEPAQVEGHSSRRGEEPSAYGVDSATGAFLSPEAAASFVRQEDTARFDAMSELMEATYVPTWSWALVQVDEGLDLAAFSSGFGDGAYASYWGLDAAGVPVVLLTDFGLLEPPGAVPDHPRRPWWKFWSAT